MQTVLSIVELTAIIVLFMGATALFGKAYNKLRTSEGDIKIGCMLSVFFMAAIFILIYIVASQFVSGISENVFIAYLVTSLVHYLLVQRVQKIMCTRKTFIKAGPRELKYNSSTISFAAFMLVAVLFYFYMLYFIFDAGNEFTEYLIGLCIALAGIGIATGRFLKTYKNQLSAIEELQKTSYVLFFRNFKEEQYPFYFGRYLPELNAKRKGLTAKLASIDIVNASFEIFFAAQFKKYIGELVGLGNPEEFMPHEHIRLLYKVNDWKDSLQSLLASCQCIVMQPSLSASIEYELTEINNSGLANKLFFLPGRRRVRYLCAFSVGELI